MQEFAEWDSFYLIIGGGAGALIGLQFVVMTLIANRPTAPEPEAGAAFGTPTIVHFCAAFFLSAILRAPWHSVVSPAVVWGLLGVAGVAYSFIVIRRMRVQNAYDPVFEDWLFHGLLPVAAYSILTVSALMAVTFTREALFVVAGSLLLLLFIGIHNSWDNTTYNVFVESGKPPESGAETSEPRDE